VAAVNIIGYCVNWGGLARGLGNSELGRERD